ncbi:MAG: PQQ-dependent dehydrogenase, methanol/ethanol family [Acidobacteria bacterium]|nr:PQQ-dependent dehydrogenase, methanol/ethanol family [Acidobacteriota bacterium]
MKRKGRAPRRQAVEEHRSVPAAGAVRFARVPQKLFLVLLATVSYAQLTHERIANGEKTPGEWLTYSGNYQGHRYSPLTAIHTANVAQIRPIWMYQVNRLDKFETSPLVIGSTMYLTEPPSNVTALDLRTGRPIWQYRRGIPEGLPICCGWVNRGPAAMGDLIYVGTLDAHLVALDARTGNVVWDTEVATARAGYSITVAPLAYKDKVVIGVAGGEFGVRGLLDAYDAKTGKRAWRFWTTPATGEPGVETWQGESWKHGSATTWTTGSYDPVTNTVFWGTGNPGPDWNGDDREGDNLYSDCLVALDGDTGKLKWYFQFTPHDVHDWDATQVPVLVDRPWRGANRKLVLFANRNAFFYLLDREKGTFLAGKPFAKQTWASGLDPKGRPIRLPDTFPSEKGTRVWPSVAGATNYFSPSYSPQTGLLYVATREENAIFYTKRMEHQEGRWFLGGRWTLDPREQPWGAIRALDPETLDRKWEYRLHTPPWAGVLSTAGGLVFGGSEEGHFYALDARTGKLLWRFLTGGKVLSSPIAFMAGGKQYIAVAAGHDLIVFGLEAVMP